MLRKLAGIVLAMGLAVAIVGASGVGSAHAAIVAGSGTLTANGTGVVGARGLLDEHVTATNGILLVKDIGGGATIDVSGASGRAPYGEATAYFGFTSAHVTGTEVAVAAVGQNISVNVTGRGWAYLKGTGTFSVNGGELQPWREEGGFAGIGAPRPAGAGAVTATGTGVVGVRGLVDEQVAATNGILLVKDIGGGANIDVIGATSQAPFGEFTAYFNFTSAHVTGTQVAVIVVGQDIGLTATGRGWAYLKGTGTYTINGGAPQPWHPDGGFAGIAAE